MDSQHKPIDGVKPQVVYTDNEGQHSLWALEAIEQVGTPLPIFIVQIDDDTYRCYYDGLNNKEMLAKGDPDMLKSPADLELSDVSWLLAANDRYRIGDHRPVVFPVGAKKHHTRRQAGAHSYAESERAVDADVASIYAPPHDWLFQYQQSQAYCVANAACISIKLYCGSVPSELDKELHQEQYKACRVSQITRMLDSYVDPVAQRNTLPFVIHRIQFQRESATTKAEAPYPMPKPLARITTPAELDVLLNLGGIAMVQHSQHATCWDLTSHLVYETDPDHPHPLPITWESLSKLDLLPITAVFHLKARCEQPAKGRHRTKRQRLRNAEFQRMLEAPANH